MHVRKQNQATKSVKRLTWKCMMMVACRGVTVRSRLSAPTLMVRVTLPKAGFHFSFLGAFRSWYLLA